VTFFLILALLWACIWFQGSIRSVGRSVTAIKVLTGWNFALTFDQESFWPLIIDLMMKFQYFSIVGWRLWPLNWHNFSGLDLWLRPWSQISILLSAMCQHLVVLLTYISMCNERFTKASPKVLQRCSTHTQEKAVWLHDWGWCLLIIRPGDETYNREKPSIHDEIWKAIIYKWVGLGNMRPQSEFTMKTHCGHGKA